jgi:hypothetical protein
MISSWRPADLIEQFAQSIRGNAMVEYPANGQIGALSALVLAEFSYKSNRGVQTMVFHMLIDDSEILRIPAGEAGTSQTNHDLHNIVTWVHGSPL